MPNGLHTSIQKPKEAVKKPPAAKAPVKKPKEAPQAPAPETNMGTSYTWGNGIRREGD